MPSPDSIPKMLEIPSPNAPSISLRPYLGSRRLLVQQKTHRTGGPTAVQGEGVSTSRRQAVKARRDHGGVPQVSAYTRLSLAIRSRTSLGTGLFSPSSISRHVGNRADARGPDAPERESPNHERSAGQRPC
jgi:hypothetical protein